ncbi:MAG: dihydroorotate dehydrogenase [Patescibacteria group bacterium]
MNLRQTILGVTFENPTVLASGILGVTASSWRRAVTEGGAGAPTTKSVWLKEHKGHKNPTIISTEHWTLNAVGVPDAGPGKARQEITAYRDPPAWQGAKPAPLIVNIIAETAENFGKTAADIVAMGPDILEVNISCPNVEDEFGKPFACSATAAAAVTKAVKAVSGAVPVFIKLSPNALSIAEIAKACAAEGADGFTVINTVGPGMAIDLKTRLPILTNKVGGMSGPAIKPIAVRCVADVYAATGGKLPIIGTGGVHTGEDAIEIMLAGASLVGIGTAVWKRGISVFKQVCDEMSLFCDAEGIKDVSELIGGMHRQSSSTPP